MAEKTYMKADEVAEILDVSTTYAYKIIRELNQELKEKGFITVIGRVNRKYFMEKACYGSTERSDS